GARGRCLSSTDVGNQGKADNRFYSDRPMRRRRMGTGRARRSRAGTPGGFSGRSWPMFTRNGWRSRKAHHPGPSLQAGVHVIGTYLAPETFSVTTSSGQKWLAQELIFIGYAAGMAEVGYRLVREGQARVLVRIQSSELGT